MHIHSSEPDLVLKEFTRKGAKVDTKRGAESFDSPRRHNKERYPDKAASVSSLEDSNLSVSEVNRPSAGNLGTRFPSTSEADRVLPATPCVDEAYAKPGHALDRSGRADMEDRAKAQGDSLDPKDIIDRTGPVDCRDPLAGMTEAVTTDTVPDRVIVAEWGCLIKVRLLEVCITCRLV